MKQIKKTKFTLEKFEVARLKNYKNIIGGVGDAVDPITVTETSNNCSGQPGCKIIVQAPVRPPSGGSL